MPEGRPARKTPTARTLEELRRRGWPGQVVERWLPGRRAKKGGAPGETEPTAYGTRKDLFGAIDILALDGCPGSLGIQACIGGDASTRAKKAATEPLLKPWLAAGNRFQVWAWREIWVETGPKTKAKRWRPRVVCLVLVDGEIVDMELEAGSGECVSGALPGAGLGSRTAIPFPGPERSGPAPGLFDLEDGL